MASEKTIQYVIIIIIIIIRSDKNIMKCRSKILYYGLSLKIQNLIEWRVIFSLHGFIWPDDCSYFVVVAFFNVENFKIMTT